MAKVKPFVFYSGKIGWEILCPACRTSHHLDSRWAFNGNMERPSFSPSLNYRCNTPDMEEYRPGMQSIICHSFIADGKIQFLDDCTHELKGKVVDLLDVLQFE